MWDYSCTGRRYDWGPICREYASDILKWRHGYEHSQSARFGAHGTGRYLKIAMQTAGMADKSASPLKLQRYKW
jgi:hypothetical protein